MEYPQLVATKRKWIINFLKWRSHWNEDLDYVPYSYSNESLRDVLNGLDYQFECKYEDLHKEKPMKSDDFVDKLILILSFADSKSKASDIAFILGYDKDEVERILSNIAEINNKTVQKQAIGPGH